MEFSQIVKKASSNKANYVEIGDGGEVVYVFINPTNLSELPVLETVPVKSGEQAFEEMKANKNFINFFSPHEIAKVLIDNVYIGYWLEGESVSQEYIAPVYRFEGICFDEKGNILKERFGGWAQAIRTT